MTPDSTESRIGRLEQTMAKLEHAVGDHEMDVRQFAPMMASHAVLEDRMLTMQRQLDSIMGRLDRDTQDRERRQEWSSKDSQQWRRTILALGVSSFISILIAAATIVATILA